MKKLYTKAKDGSIVPAHELNCQIGWCDSTIVVPSDVSDAEMAKALGWTMFRSSGFSQGNGVGAICHMHVVETEEEA